MKVIFNTADGERVEAEAQAGDVLLRVGQAAGMPLEGTCEGQMACSTCHVLVAKEWFAQLPEASEDEEDMLDLAFDSLPKLIDLQKRAIATPLSEQKVTVWL